MCLYYLPYSFLSFQSRCRDLGVGEAAAGFNASAVTLFQSRCRDLGVGESQRLELVAYRKAFQSRCRDLGVGERPPLGG